MFEFSQQNRPASTHFIIGKSGELVQMVDLDDVAFHTFRRPHPFDRGLPRVTNDNAVGVELEGPIFDVFTTAQLQKLAQLLRMMHDLYGISLDYDPKRNFVLGHDEIHPSCKKDPWENFPYKKVLQWAQSVQPYDTKKLFQKPLDITGSTEALVAEAKRDALTLESGLLREVAIAAADSIDVDVRAQRKRTVDRDMLMQARTTFSDKQEVNISERNASFSKTETVNTDVLVSSPLTGILFDWTAGIWKATED